MTKYETVRAVFFISDMTGITAEVLGNSLLTQFNTVKFKKFTMPFIDTNDKAHETIANIRQIEQETKAQAIVFTTLISAPIRQIFNESELNIIDLFASHLEQLSIMLNKAPLNVIGLSHNIKNAEYATKMEALNFALAFDDGVNIDRCANPDLILIGVSRVGKTPTSIYLAMHYGIKVANYPLVDQELANKEIPAFLLDKKDKLLALVISPDKLLQIRTSRMPDSNYSSHEKCFTETKQANDLYSKYNIMKIDTTHTSIEELSAKIMLLKDLNRNI